MSRHPFRHRRAAGSAAVLVAALGLASPTAAGAVTWFPTPSTLSRLAADPSEPRMGLLVDGGGDRIDGALGGRFPIAGSGIGEGAWTATLEAGGFLTLGREGSFFPLQTFDGVFGGAVDARRAAWTVRLRVLHRSAHKADGDSTASYPGETFSREFVWLDVLHGAPGRTIYGRIGGSWHAVPRDPGPRIALGGEWRCGATPWRPLVAAHLESAREHDWKMTISVIAGLTLGENGRAFLGLRYHRGEPPQGQYADERQERFGVEIQLLPGAPSKGGG